jgi:hypothetical protein
MYTVYSRYVPGTSATTLEFPPGEYCFAFFGGVHNSGTAYTFTATDNEKAYLKALKFNKYSTDFGISPDGGFWGKLADYTSILTTDKATSVDYLVGVNAGRLCRLDSSWRNAII